MPAPKKSQTYQEMTTLLNQLMKWFESDKVNLDEAVEKYEQAMELLSSMQDYVNTAENKVKKIAAKFGTD